MGLGTVAMAPTHRQRGLGDEFRHLRADHMHAQHQIALGIGDHLDHALGFVHRQGPAAGGKGELADPDLVAFLPGLLFAQPDRGDLRVGKDRPGHGPVIDAFMGVSGHHPGGDQPLLARLVGQERRGRDIANGKNMGDSSSQMLIDGDHASVIYRKPGLFQCQTFSVSPSTCSY